MINKLYNILFFNIAYIRLITFSYNILFDNTTVFSLNLVPIQFILLMYQ